MGIKRLVGGSDERKVDLAGDTNVMAKTMLLLLLVVVVVEVVVEVLLLLVAVTISYWCWLWWRGGVGHQVSWEAAVLAVVEEMLSVG